MNIFFTGYMASGKTLIGRQLALEMGFPFFDLDHFIEERNGKSVAEIFKLEGEAVFRQKEAEALRSLPLEENTIISCGGGTFCFPGNREWIQQHGISVYLQVSPDVLAIRLSGDQNQRPIIKAHNSSKKDLSNFIQQHLSSRLECYEQADIIYLGEDSPEQIVVDLRDYFFRFLPR